MAYTFMGINTWIAPLSMTYILPDDGASTWPDVKHPLCAYEDPRAAQLQPITALMDGIWYLNYHFTYYGTKIPSAGLMPGVKYRQGMINKLYHRAIWAHYCIHVLGCRYYSLLNECDVVLGHAKWYTVTFTMDSKVYDTLQMDHWQIWPEFVVCEPADWEDFLLWMHISALMVCGHASVYDVWGLQRHIHSYMVEQCYADWQPLFGVNEGRYHRNSMPFIDIYGSSQRTNRQTTAWWVQFLLCAVLKVNLQFLWMSFVISLYVSSNIK